MKTTNIFLVFMNLDVQEKDDAKANISFGEFVSSMWVEHQVLAQTTNILPYSKRSVVNADKLTGKSEMDEDSILMPPNLAKYDFNPQRVSDLLKEYGAMLPSKDVYCTPDVKVISFLK